MPFSSPSLWCFSVSFACWLFFCIRADGFPLHSSSAVGVALVLMGFRCVFVFPFAFSFVLKVSISLCSCRWIWLRSDGFLFHLLLALDFSFVLKVSISLWSFHVLFLRVDCLPFFLSVFFLSHSCWRFFISVGSCCWLSVCRRFASAIIDVCSNDLFYLVFILTVIVLSSLYSR